MKKTNKKGFTLVELIIVATIMVMIMGAILNWIRPMNKFYDRTQELADSNDIGSLLMDAVDDELRYCTNVLVLEDYQGLPSVVNGYVVNNSGNPAFSARFTDVLIIDNNNFRGQLFADYDANGTVAHRKGARGCIMHAFIPDDTGIIDTTRLKCIGQGGENLYNDYGCHFDASLNILENKSKCVTIDMAVSRPRVRGGAYVFDKVSYNQSRDFELVNVNLKLANMNAAYYTAKGEGNSIDYTKFAQSSDGATGNQTPLLTGTYTYIFYTKEVPESENVKVTLYKDTDVLWSFEKEPGSTLTPEEIQKLKDTAKSQANTNWQPDSQPNTYIRERQPDIIDGEGNLVDIYETTPITSPLDLQYVPVYERRTDAPCKLTFKERFNDGGENTGAVDGYSKSVSFYPYDTSKGDDGIVSYRDGNPDQKDKIYTFVGWFKDDPNHEGKPSGDKDADLSAGWFVDGAQYTDSATYYAIYEKKDTILLVYTVNNPDDLDTTFFISQDRYLMDLTYVDLLKDSRYTYATEEVKKAAKSGLTFVEWIVTDASDNEIGKLQDFDSLSLTKDELYKAKAVFKENPYPGSYEIKIIVKKAHQWYTSLNVDNDGSNKPHFGVFEEDGVTAFRGHDNIYDWNLSDGGSVNSFVSDGQVLRIFVYNNVPVVVSMNGVNKTLVDKDCTFEYDASDTDNPKFIRIS